MGKAAESRHLRKSRQLLCLLERKPAALEELMALQMKLALYLYKVITDLFFRHSDLPV